MKKTKQSHFTVASHFAIIPILALLIAGFPNEQLKSETIKRPNKTSLVTIEILKGQQSQPDTIRKEEEAPYVIVEQMPEFPGGDKALKQWIEQNLQYPEEAKNRNIQGTVYVRFVINIYGKVERTEIARGVNPLLDTEALRLIKSMPNWIPAKQGGKSVPVSLTIPVKFLIQSPLEVNTPNKDQTLAPYLEEEDPPFVIVEQMPDFPGGEKALLQYFEQNIHYPEDAKKGNIQGTVYVRCIIDRLGKVEKAEVKKGVHPALDAEAIRLISSMPDWIPGRQGGKAVRVSYTFPVKFEIK
jgi:TonB family protein